MNIHEWIDSALLLLESKQFVDIHINDINSAYKPFDQWLVGLQTLLDEANSIVAKLDDPSKVAGCISLRGSDRPLGFSVNTYVDLISQMDDITPPSIYLFNRKSVPWLQPDSEFVSVALPSEQGILLHDKLLFLEYLEPNEDEFRRSLWLLTD